MRKAVPAVAVAALLAAFPASALAAKGTIKSVSNSMGSTTGISVTIACVEVTTPGPLRAASFSVPYTAADAKLIDQLEPLIAGALGVPTTALAPVPAGAGTLTFTVTPNGTCSGGGSTGPTA